MHNVSPTIRTYACLQVAKPALAFPPHQLQVGLPLCHSRPQRWGHFRRRLLTSAVETTGPDTLVIPTSATSWNHRLRFRLATTRPAWLTGREESEPALGEQTRGATETTASSGDIAEATARAVFRAGGLSSACGA